MTLVKQEPNIRLELRLTKCVGPLVVILGDVLDGRQLCCLRPEGHPLQNQILLPPFAYLAYPDLLGVRGLSDHGVVI